MRDYLVTLLIFGSLPFILARPYIGVLVWSWISYMNPHRLTWGFAYDMPFGKLVAGTLFISLLFSRDLRRPPTFPIVWVWLTFIVWMCLSTVMAIFPNDAAVMLSRVLKIQLIIFLTMMIMRTRERLHWMLWVMFLSVGFFGIKGGIFTVLNAGSFRVWGPPESFIEDNNHLATALLMILPIGIYLMREIPRRWGKWLLGLALFFILVSVVGSYSRGAFLAIIAVAFFLWWKSRRKGLVAMMVLPLLPIIFLAMPEGWHARMETITNYQEDYSAMGRLNAWEYAINAANARLFGAGMESWSVKTFAQWAPNPADVHAAHSIYFSVLADHGWPGLVLFVAIFWMAWRTASRIIVVASRTDGYGWMSDLARMLQVSFVAYAAGGAFLSLSYFDLPWHLVCLVVIMRAMLEDDGIALTQRRVPLKQASSTRGGTE